MPLAAKHDKPPAKFNRAMRWFILLLIAGNVLAYIIRERVGPIDTLFEPSGNAVKTSTVADTAGAQQAVPGIALLQQESSGNRLDSKGELAVDAFNDGELCWFIALSAHNNYFGQEDTKRVVADTEAPTQQNLTTLQSRLASLEIAAQVVKVEVVDATQYMVIVSNVAGGDEVATLQRLLARGHDAFVVQLDNQSRAVVLDIFASEAEANDAAAKFMGSGLAVEVLTYAESDVLPRLRLGVPESAKLSRRLWSKLQIDFPGIEKEKKYCQSIAPPA